MADDEKLTIDAEELAEQAEDVAEQAEDVVEQVEDAAQQVEETIADADVVDDAPVADEKVEAAVRHVAEEAEADMARAAGKEEDVPAEQAPKKRERRSKQARAEKAARVGAIDAPAKGGTSKLASLGPATWIAISIACLALGLALGRFVLGGAAGGGSLNGKTTVSEAELDSTYATYVYNGKTNTITVREVIEQSGSVESAITEDGSYALPAAEYAVNAARTAILNAEVESRNITVSEEDVAAYAEQTLGTSDYEAIASTYGLEAQAVKELIEENCRMTALREEVIGGELPTAPTAPTAPEEGKEAEVTKEYADYIISLVGDEWNSKKGKWASEDGPYATALAEQDFSADGASYTAAQAAYYVAYQLYTEQSTAMTNTWTEFINGLMSNASIEIGTLIS